MLECEAYTEAVQKLRPDIAIGMGDLLFGHEPGVKRKEVMGDRTLAWMKMLAARMEDQGAGTPTTVLFAPILPIEAEQQSWYLDSLGDELKAMVSGVALYDTGSVDAIPDNLRNLPRLLSGDVSSPQKILNAISLGVDILTIPFLNEVTDAGIALLFSIPASSPSNTEVDLPLGVDMWSSSHSTDLTPIQEECKCYTCTQHHRAYIKHLLDAKEMLGWVLLQIHNLHATDQFFEAIRASIKQGTFEPDRKAFSKRYAAELPAKTGQGPR